MRWLLWLGAMGAGMDVQGALLVDRIDWGQVAGNYVQVASPLGVHSEGGVAVSVGQQGPVFERRDQSNGWYGNFLPGEQLLWNYYGGAVTLDFAGPGAGAITGIEFQIQASVYGAFTALLELYGADGSLVASRQGDGLSNAMGDGGALRLSLTGTPFTQARIRLTAGAELSSFAIGSVAFSQNEPTDWPGTGWPGTGAPSAVPEPSTLLLGGAALAGMAFRFRRR